MDRGGSILHRGGPFSTVENGPGGTFLGGSIFNLTQAMLLTIFHAFLRIGEVTASRNNILRCKYRCNARVQLLLFIGPSI